MFQSGIGYKNTNQRKYLQRRKGKLMNLNKQAQSFYDKNYSGIYTTVKYNCLSSARQVGVAYYTICFEQV